MVFYLCVWEQVVSNSTVDRAPSSFHVQSVQIHPVLWPYGDVLRLLLENFIFEAKTVDSGHVLASVSLEAACHETLREEEDRQRKRRGLAANEPLTHELHAEQ